MITKCLSEPTKITSFQAFSGAIAATSYLRLLTTTSPVSGACKASSKASSGPKIRSSARFGTKMTLSWPQVETRLAFSSGTPTAFRKRPFSTSSSQELSWTSPGKTRGSWQPQAIRKSTCGLSTCQSFRNKYGKAIRAASKASSGTSEAICLPPLPQTTIRSSSGRQSPVSRF